MEVPENSIEFTISTREKTKWSLIFCGIGLILAAVSFLLDRMIWVGIGLGIFAVGIWFFLSRTRYYITETEVIKHFKTPGTKDEVLSIPIADIVSIEPDSSRDVAKITLASGQHYGFDCLSEKDFERFLNEVEKRLVN